MKTKEVSINFTDTAEEEVRNLVNDLQLIPVATYLQKSDAPLPPELQSMITQLLATLSDLFSSELPDVDPDPEATLRTISRDINLARLLRERGLFRLFRLTRHTDGNGLPAFMSLINPDTGGPFSTQKEFIGWFCREAHVSRGLVFMRNSTIDKILSLNLTLQDAFNLVISKPYAIQETLNMIAVWEDGELRDINTEVALQMAKKVSPTRVPQLEAVAATFDSDPDAIEDFKEMTKPVIADLLYEVASHDRAKEVMNMVKHDILLKPEITYEWDRMSGILMVRLVRKEVDSETGVDVTTHPIMVPFVPDTPDLPDEIAEDLIRRLPIRNRHEL